MAETCGFVTVLDRPCGRPAIWMFCSQHVRETHAVVAEGLCKLHGQIATLEAAFGCESTYFSVQPIPEGSPL